MLLHVGRVSVIRIALCEIRLQVGISIVPSNTSNHWPKGENEFKKEKKDNAVSSGRISV